MLEKREIGLLLPLSTLLLLTKYSNLVMTGSVALIFFSLWFLRAFQKIELK